MMDTRLDTIAINKLELAATSGRGVANNNRRSATLITGASKSPLRVVVENVSFAAEVYLAVDASTLQTNEPGANTFLLNAGRTLTTVLAPGQQLNAISLSDGAVVSIAISEALPIDTKP